MCQPTPLTLAMTATAEAARDNLDVGEQPEQQDRGPREGEEAAKAGGSPGAYGGRRQVEQARRGQHRRQLAVNAQLEGSAQGEQGRLAEVPVGAW